MNSSVMTAAANGKTPLSKALAASSILKVSSSTPVQLHNDGTLRLVVTSSASGALSPSPNVSVTAAPPEAKRVPAPPSRAHSTSEPQKTSNKKDGSSSSVPKGKEIKEISLKSDLRNIMHAFGDANTPCEESVQMIELILRQEMVAFVFICDNAAYWSGSRVLGLRECVYALKNDKPFLSHLLKYFVLKDQHQKTARHTQQGQQKTPPYTRHFIAEIRDILDDLDETGEFESLLELDSGPDNSKSVKAHLEVIHCIRSPTYLNYAKARSVSFGRKLSQLPEWVSLYIHSEYKLSHSFMEVLAYLIYDLVAQIVDLSFAVKRERTNSSNPVIKLCDPRGGNPDTCMSATMFLRKEEECTNVSEILVLASELEAKRLKKATTSSRETVTTTSVHSLSPSEIQEAYIRMQSSPPPSVSFRTRAEKLRQFNFQYLT